MSIGISDAEFTGAREEGEEGTHTSEEGKERGGEGWLSLFMEHTGLGFAKKINFSVKKGQSIPFTVFKVFNKLLQISVFHFVFAIKR